MNRSDSNLTIAEARRLLEAVVEASDASLGTDERRQCLLERLCELLEADFGHSAIWYGAGVRAESTSSSVCVAEPVERARLEEIAGDIIEHCLRSGWNTDSANHTTLRRQEVEAASKPSPLERRCADEGIGDWLVSIRQHPIDGPMSLLLARRADRPDFTAENARLLDFTVENLAWLHSGTRLALQPESFRGLTKRQSDVMKQLLAGLSRKQIADRLEISEHTVGDHIKAIYRHFGVSAVNELAALVLRGQ